MTTTTTTVHMHECHRCGWSVPRLRRVAPGRCARCDRQMYVRTISPTHADILRAAQAEEADVARWARTRGEE